MAHCSSDTSGDTAACRRITRRIQTTGKAHARVNAQSLQQHKGNCTVTHRAAEPSECSGHSKNCSATIVWRGWLETGEPFIIHRAEDWLSDARRYRAVIKCRILPWATGQRWVLPAKQGDPDRAASEFHCGNSVGEDWFRGPLSEFVCFSSISQRFPQSIGNSVFKWIGLQKASTPVACNVTGQSKKFRSLNSFVAFVTIPGYRYCNSECTAPPPPALPLK